MLMWIALGGCALLIVYYVRRQRALAADPAQHHLATLMIAAVAGIEGKSDADVRAYIRTQGWNAAHTRIRVTQAVLATRATVPPERYEQLLNLSRRLLNNAL